MRRTLYLILILAMVSIGAAPTRQNTYTSGSTIASANVTANEDAILNYLQAGVDTYAAGSISNAAINASASIADSKLAQITTASKVHGTSITGLASLPSGAGEIPAANLPAGASVTTESREMDAASGDVSYTGAGFTPTAAIAFAAVDGDASMSWGMVDTDTAASLFNSDGGTTLTSILSDTTFIQLDEDNTKDQRALLSSFDSDGITLTWTKVSTPASATADITIIYFK